MSQPTTPPQPNGLHVLAYGPAGMVERQDASALDDLEQLLREHPVTWINVEGPVEDPLLARIGELLGLHRLAIEDVAQVRERAKYEAYEDHIFVVTRMMRAENLEVSEQISIFVGPRWVVTFQEGRPGDVLEPLRVRIREGRGRVCQSGPDYLLHAMLDAVVDNYFPVIERFGDLLDEYEEHLDVERNDGVLSQLHDVRRNLLGVRRAIWPQREVLHQLLKDTSGLISPETQIYLRDVYDHTIQLIDLVETYRELASGLVELANTITAQRLNEVMKFLTVISTIFIPLSFVAGVYGMNFDPGAGRLSMPELRHPLGYVLTLTAMAVAMASMLYLFWRRGWLSSGRRRR